MGEREVLTQRGCTGGAVARDLGCPVCPVCTTFQGCVHFLVVLGQVQRGVDPGSDKQVGPSDNHAIDQ